MLVLIWLHKKLAYKFWIVRFAGFRQSHGKSLQNREGIPNILWESKLALQNLTSPDKYSMKREIFHGYARYYSLWWPQDIKRREGKTPSSSCGPFRMFCCTQTNKILNSKRKIASERRSVVPKIQGLRDFHAAISPKIAMFRKKYIFKWLFLFIVMFVS